MATHKDIRPLNRPRASHEETMRRIVWNNTSDADPAYVRDWDIKPEQLADAILHVLATGSAVMFSTTQAGGAISITLYSGDQKARTYVSDSMGLDDWSDVTLAKARKFLDSGKPEQAAD